MRRPVSGVIAVLVLAAGLAWPVSDAAPGGPRFVSGIADLPLMPGLSERPEQAVVFENRNGRIVRATAIGRLAKPAVRRYYRDALPALGWLPAGADRFVREGELLRLELVSGDRGLAVRFSLSPHQTPAK